MRTLFLASALLLSLTTFGQAQWGLMVNYSNNQAENWKLGDNPDGSFQERSILGQGYSASLDYRLRIPRTRIEFLPALGMGRAARTFTESPNSRIAPPLEFSVRYAGFNLPVHIYFLDLDGDCDCPTFSRQGPSLKKGLFLMISAGINYLDLSLENQTANIDQGSWAGNLGVGLGLDLGLNKRLTISPLLRGIYSPSVRWEKLVPPDNTMAIQPDFTPNSPLMQFQPGIRLGFQL
jgi:hypothetical protein